jgi:hypothetical protein
MCTSHKIEDVGKYTTVKVSVMLMNGMEIDGNINILTHKRFSDFLEDNPFQFIRLHNARMNNKAIEHAGKRFLLIPKDKILFFEPFDKQKMTGRNPKIA